MPSPCCCSDDRPCSPPDSVCFKRLCEPAPVNECLRTNNAICFLAFRLTWSPRCALLPMHAPARFHAASRRRASRSASVGSLRDASDLEARRGERLVQVGAGRRYACVEARPAIAGGDAQFADFNRASADDSIDRYLVHSRRVWRHAAARWARLRRVDAGRARSSGFPTSPRCTRSDRSARGSSVSQANRARRQLTEATRHSFETVMQLGAGRISCGARRRSCPAAHVKLVGATSLVASLARTPYAWGARQGDPRAEDVPRRSIAPIAC